MNYISKTHQRFSERLNDPRILECPEEFLGENYEAVLNFWLILDDLSEDQLRVVQECYWAFYNENHSEWKKEADLAWDSSKELVGSDYAYYASKPTYDNTNSAAARLATQELIAMHKILEDHQQPLTFFEMFLDLLS